MVRILGAPTAKPILAVTKSKLPNQFETISEEDLFKADEQMTREILWYAGYTAITVAAFLVVAFCFANDPRSCIIAFGTGSPCCLLCPYVRTLYKFTDPTKLIQGSVNTYVPGILVMDDGKMETYEPSQEEIDLMLQLIQEITK